MLVQSHTGTRTTDITDINMVQDLVQADPEPVAVKVRVLPCLPCFRGRWDCQVSGRPAGGRRGGVLLVAEMFVLKNVIGVLPL